ncbi:MULTISPECIES: hypothetical protein [unclassified Halomonas]|uniref:hypothetical protein n=1 Tax=unclassified Halomonas TaxID=2609666 RepID=UPI0020976DF2|nr:MULTISPECIES: hypothetical protein [unclassified Halomonas]MCO7243539.1 hypothetical protein [Halomonas sp. Ps84H-12]MCP1303607.1 hypothetical protein [Halomonas sp. R1t8]MCP1329580.1 hypothetical protein [Halomonas sp. R1t4]
MADFRSTRIGVANAARILNVRVAELKEAVRHDQPLYGVRLPKPIGYLGASAKEMYFTAGEIMDAADLIAQQRKAP